MENLSLKIIVPVAAIAIGLIAILVLINPAPPIDENLPIDNGFPAKPENNLSASVEGQEPVLVDPSPDDLELLDKAPGFEEGPDPSGGIPPGQPTEEELPV